MSGPAAPVADPDAEPTADAPGWLRVVRPQETLRRRTLAKIREAILTGYFAPGQRLVEREICEATGVSRSSVREALRYLESEGLVESRGTKGIFVTVLDLSQAQEIYELRSAVESEAARHFAARAEAAELQALADTMAHIRAIANRDPVEYWKATDRFFDLILKGARNRTAYELMMTLRARISFLRATTTRLARRDYRDASVRHMSLIAEALLARDGEAAARLCRDFIARSARFAEACLKQQEAMRPS